MNIKLIFLGSLLIFFGQIAAQETTTLLGKKVESIQVIDFESMPHDTISEGITRQWFHGAKGQMAYFHLKKGAHIPMHKHPNEQITYILKGKVKINTIDKGKRKTYIISAGQVIVFPENVSHEFFALENTLDLDVHVPVRQDWLTNELPAYLKKSK
ncbi:cupin domain-containing protein [Tenacibaculum singaporense]|uniref:Cupin domain-containing protein n=1 Tax=Tenacibaculum singaporense TaxID=2358479 RepID=A0A3S8R7A5_9FLAO|nr:cupin domain-containing protein [Tenacibaculum singaporense]AZJ35669.1 cupin domain-containing protein [Tenacibaculum singaporense]